MIYEIADLKIKFNNKFAYTDKFCEKYAIDTDGFDVVAEVNEEDVELERRAFPGYSEGYIENICLYRSLCNKLPLFDRFLLHSSVITFDGEAYAFAGESGAGKSTHTGLWLKYVGGAEILNGDKPIIAYSGGVFTAYGTPWNGKENRGRKGKAPLKALCFIEKAKVNEIVKISSGEAAMRVFKQLLLPAEEKAAARTLELVDRLICEVPSFVLKCDMSEEAVRTAFSALTGKIYEENRK